MYEHFGILPYSCSNNQKVYLSSINISSIEIISLVFGFIPLILGVCGIIFIVAVFQCFREDDISTGTTIRIRRILLKCSGICYILCSISQGLTLLIFNGIICQESRLEGRHCSLGAAGICSVIASVFWFIQGMIVFWIIINKKHQLLKSSNNDIVVLQTTTSNHNSTERKKQNKSFQPAKKDSSSITTNKIITNKIPKEIHLLNSMHIMNSSNEVYNF